jgi:hypothetical protein
VDYILFISSSSSLSSGGGGDGGRGFYCLFYKVFAPSSIRESNPLLNAVPLNPLFVFNVSAAIFKGGWFKRR